MKSRVVKRSGKRGEQLELELPTWGGARQGAGRKRVAVRATVPHVARARTRDYNPVFVTIRMHDHVPSLRERTAWAVIVRTMRAFRGRWGLRVVHYTVIENHLHLICETEGGDALSKGMQALMTRLGKALNRHFGHKGTAFAGRFHARELRTPSEVRYALQYVLLNARKHAAELGMELPREWLDDRSTGAIFDGWSDPLDIPERNADFGTSPAQSWLLRIGWRQLGLLDRTAIPGGVEITRPRRRHLESADIEAPRSGTLRARDRISNRQTSTLETTTDASHLGARCSIAVEVVACRLARPRAAIGLVRTPSRDAGAASDLQGTQEILVER